MQLKSTIAGAALASVLWVAPAFAADLVFTLDNQSTSAINEFYVSGVDQNDWGKDILGQDVLSGGSQATITIYDAGDVCQFDLRLVYEDGSTTDERGIDVCELENATYAVTD